METIYENALAKVEIGARFRIDLQKRDFKINNKYVIKNGVYEGELGVSLDSQETFLNKMNKLYRNYRYSIPSERDSNNPSKYFVALPEDELEDDDMLYGEHRSKAQCALELYLLCQIIMGFKLDIPGFFWQSKNEKGLIILNEWWKKK